MDWRDSLLSVGSNICCVGLEQAIRHLVYVTNVEKVVEKSPGEVGRPPGANLLAKSTCEDYGSLGSLFDPYLLDLGALGGRKRPNGAHVVPLLPHCRATLRADRASLA